MDSVKYAYPTYPVNRVYMNILVPSVGDPTNTPYHVKLVWIINSDLSTQISQLCLTRSM